MKEVLIAGILLLVVVLFLGQDYHYYHRSRPLIVPEPYPILVPRPYPVPCPSPYHPHPCEIS